MRVTSLKGPLDLQGHVLVIPGSGGLAHLAELAVDAVVTSFGLSRAAIISSRNVLPVVMASAWKAPEEAPGVELTTGAELYQALDGKLKLSVLQLRGPVVEGRRRALAQELLFWAREAGVAEIIILASCSSHMKTDADFAADTELRSIQQIRKSPGMELGDRVIPLGHSLSSELQSGEPPSVYQILRGSGIARPLLLLAEEAAADADGPDFPTITCLLGLTGEVLNWPVMEQLSHTVCTGLSRRLEGTAEVTLRAPPSWRYYASMTASPQQLWG